ncbi:MAG: 3-methyl-2-oxobutanoate hydroxymethyltransferase [Acidobacteria bacterium]|nr:3-methyl-2-oxobutanoate hydroxymethyltransferase [Acidobacteriota bacterium]
MQPKSIRVPDFRDRKRRGEKIAMLTAYDATMARLLDLAGVDALLVGDSLGMVVLGYENTIPVTLDDIIHHAKAVARGAERALVVADMPFLTYQIDHAEALRNARRLLQEGHAAAVKLEGGRSIIDVVKRLVDVGVPVMGHLGLLPQSVHQVGGFLRQATRPEDADRLVADAHALEEAGAFAIVLEAVPPAVARSATVHVGIPTIGIGAGPDCDGQILVCNDVLGLFDRFVPPFVKQYAQLADVVVSAGRAYVDDVRAGRYPTPTRETAGTQTTT